MASYPYIPKSKNKKFLNLRIILCPPDTQIRDWQETNQGSTHWDKPTPNGPKLPKYENTAQMKTGQTQPKEGQAQTHTLSRADHHCHCAPHCQPPPPTSNPPPPQDTTRKGRDPKLEDQKLPDRNTKLTPWSKNPMTNGPVTTDKKINIRPFDRPPRAN